MITGIVSMVSTPQRRVGHDKKGDPFFGTHAPFYGTQEPKNGAVFESSIRSTEHVFRWSAFETQNTDPTLKVHTVLMNKHDVFSDMLFSANQTTLSRRKTPCLPFILTYLLPSGLGFHAVGQDFGNHL